MVKLMAKLQIKHQKQNEDIMLNDMHQVILSKSMFRFILICGVLFIITSCNKSKREISNKEITIRLSTKDCDPIIKINSTGYHYYKCLLYNPEEGSFKIDISNEPIVDKILNMQDQDWNTLSEDSELGCKWVTNSLIVDVKEGRKIKTYELGGRINCKAKYKFLDELQEFFQELDGRWY